MSNDTTALARIEQKLIQGGAALPVKQDANGVEHGLSIALLLVREEIETAQAPAAASGAAPQPSDAMIDAGLAAYHAEVSRQTCRWRSVGTEIDPRARVVEVVRAALAAAAAQAAQPPECEPGALGNCSTCQYGQIVEPPAFCARCDRTQPRYANYEPARFDAAPAAAGGAAGATGEQA